MYKFKEEFLDEGEQKINLFFAFHYQKRIYLAHNFFCLYGLP